MEGINAADILGIVFLGYGIIDGYRKGFVKKGILFGISILTLVLVYMASPYVAEFSGGYFPQRFLWRMCWERTAISTDCSS